MLLSLFLGFCILAVGLGWYYSGPGYKGPVSDHFDGTRFRNLSGASAKGMWEVMQWMAKRQQGPWTYREAANAPKPAMAVSSGISITFVNHSTFLIQVNGLNILTDPVWSERVSPVSFAGPKRMRPPGIAFDSLPPIDIVLLSHNHYDHLDLPTLHRLQDKYAPNIISPLGISAFLSQQGIPGSTDLDWWESLTHQGLTIHCTPAQHFSGRGLFDRDQTLWGGFVLSTSSGNVYFAGDSGYGSFFKDIGDRLGPMAVSIIPIGAFLPEWFMSPIHISPSDAVQVHQDVRSAYSIGCHYGTFPMADDGMHDPVNHLQEALQQRGISDSTFLVLEEGSTWRQPTAPTAPTL